jgi:type III pantothenate kinase
MISHDTLIAIDIGNSRLKFGLFDRAATDEVQLPEPIDTLGLPHEDGTGGFDVGALAAWCDKHQVADAAWIVSSVHRGTSDRLAAAVGDLARSRKCDWPVRLLTNRDLSLVIHLDQPERLGIDRVVASFAVNRVRDPRRAAVVVDMGTATTVDLVQEDGSFVGGAILPGVGLSARALAEHTDVLPLVSLENLEQLPEPLGKSAVPAIQSGLFWGAVGGIRELVTRFSDGLPELPDVFLTGGASPHVAEALADGRHTVRHLPHLVLSGIALAALELSEE